MIRSSDTLEDVMALGNEDLYGRLALWLMDASEEEIAAYWSHHTSQQGRSREVTDLIMIHWTRLNPEGATAAVEGTGYMKFAWWAWACSDPEGALEAGMAKNPSRMADVGWGLGEFHPKWFRENFDRIPEAARGHALMGFMKWGEIDNAVETMEFLRKLGRAPSESLLKNFVRQDPSAAYEWFKENPSGTWGDPRQGSMKLMIETLAESHPDVLQSLIAQEPSGARKQSMEAAAFEGLLKHDLDVALEVAESTRAPKIASERMAAVGVRLSRTDPDQAFAIAERLFADHPNALQNFTRIEYPNGSSSSSSGGSASATALVDSLIADDPARLMDQLTADPEAGQTGRASVDSQVASRWAQYDVEGYAQWAVDHENPAMVARSAPIIFNQLQNMERYGEALDWSGSLAGNRQSYSRSSVLRNWQRRDPEAARRWLESAELPPEEHDQLRKMLER